MFHIIARCENYRLIENPLQEHINEKCKCKRKHHYRYYYVCMSICISLVMSLIS